MAAARRASTPATLIRYSMVPRLSSIGLHAARAAASRASQRGLVELVSDQRRGGLASPAVRRRHRTQRTRASRADAAGVERHVDPAPTTAMSISVRGMKRR